MAISTYNSISEQILFIELTNKLHNVGEKFAEKWSSYVNYIIHYDGSILNLDFECLVYGALAVGLRWYLR